MAKGFNAAPDERVFKLFAALNAAGYDDEWNSGGMHPVRQEVRQRLKGYSPPWLPKLREVLSQTHQWTLLFWVLNHDKDDQTVCVGQDLENYIKTNWEPVDDNDQRSVWFKQFLSGLPDLMCSIMSDPLLTQLWEEYRSPHEAEALAYREIAARGIETLEAYLRPKTEPHWSVVFVPNLLDSYATGYEVDAANVVYVVQGPSQSRGPGAVIHEYCHKLVNPVVNAQADLLRETAHLLTKYANADDPMHRPYFQWGTFVAENLVEAVTLRTRRSEPEVYEGTLRHIVEVRHLMLVEKFLDPLVEFEDSGAHYEDFFPEMLCRVIRAL